MLRTSRPLVLSLAFVLAGSGALLLGTAASAADLLSIKRLAPEKSILIMGIDDIGATRTRFQKTPMAAWWESKEVQAESKKWREDFDKGVEEMTQELGVDRDTVQWPASAGFAMFAEMNEETGMFEPGYIAFVDWGQEAENFGKLYDAGVAKMEKDKSTEFEVEDIKGRRVYVITMDQGADDDAAAGGFGDDDEGDDEMDGGMDGMDGGMDGPFSMPTKLYVTRDAGRLLIAGAAPAMQDLLGLVDGDKRETIGDSEDFRGTMELSAGTDAYAGLLMGPAQQLLASFGPEASMSMPFVSKLFGDVRGLGVGLSIDTPSAQLASTMGVYTPAGKVGLLSLLPASAIEKVPSIVPSDAMSYSKMNLQFSGIMRVVDDILASLPEEMQGMIQPMMEPYDPIVRPALAAMGPGMHMWSSLKQPITLESQSTMTAITVNDPKPVQSMIQMFAPQAGMAPRDFLGNTIYAGDPAFMTMAVGFGGPFVIIGGADGVEQSLRAIGSKDAAGGASLENDRGYKAAMAGVDGDDLVGYGFSNTVMMIEAQHAMMEWLEEMIGQIEERAATGLPAGIDANFGTLTELLKPELLRNYLGPASWQLHSVSKGFRFESRLLAPQK
ncbi:MAG: hypothetical protein SGJ11_00495 [Phycisphaerae bacterium]|nr:hypothetical protein [Phycisphaerae bacterium]